MKIKSKVFQIAHSIKDQFSSWSDCLKAAWKIAKIFNGRPTTVTFAKSSGEVRTAEAIACSTLETLKKGFVRFVEKVEHGTQWRSFRLERLIF